MRIFRAQIEALLGFDLPVPARLYRPWWANRKRGAGHSHALAWYAAGWKTRAADLETETLMFERVKDLPDGTGAASEKRDFDLDAIWPAIPGGSWPPGFTVSREQIYDDAGRLTGGPQDEAGRGR